MPTEMKLKKVIAVVTSYWYVELLATELKKNGKFTFGGVLSMEFKKKFTVASSLASSMRIK